MHLMIQLPHTSDSTAVRDHAERALRFALTRFTDLIREIRLRLVDENGPRGGIDQRCRVQVTLRSGATVSVEGLGADTFVVIQEVSARAARTIARRLSRAKDTRVR